MTDGTPPRPRVSAAGLAFVRRQERDWMVTVVRTSLDRLAIASGRQTTDQLPAVLDAGSSI